MSAIHTIDGQEIVAYGDMFEYVEDADFTEYRKTGPYKGQYIIESFKPIEDPDFVTIDDAIELNDGELYQKVNFGEAYDERQPYVRESTLGHDISIIYEWNEKKSLYVPFNGVPYICEEDAQIKINELE